MGNKEGEDGYDITQNMTSTCIDTFGDHFKNICAEVVDVADELLTTIANTPDAIYELSLIYSSQEESRDNINVEDLVSQESRMYLTQEGLYTTRVEDLVSQDSSQTKVEDSQDSSQAKTKVEDLVSQDLSHAKTKVEDPVSQGSSQAKTKVEDPVSQDSSHAKTKVEDPFFQDSSQAKTKVEDSIPQDSSQDKIKSEGLDSQEPSQIKNKIEDLVSQNSSHVNNKIGDLVSQVSSHVNNKIGDLVSQESSHVNNKIGDLVSQESSHVNTKIGDLVSQDSSLDKPTTMMPNEWHTEENSKTSNIEDLNSYERSGHGHGDVSLKSRHNNEVNSSYSSQNESSICSSPPSQFQDESFDSSGKTSSSLKSTDRDFLWVTRELDGNAYEVPNETAIGSIHRKELNMVSELRSLKIDNDKIDTNPLRIEELKNIINLEDGWDDSLIHAGELEESIVPKNSNKKITYKKKMKSVLTSPKFLLSKKESSSAKGVEQTDPRHQQIPLPIKEYSIDFGWEVL